jgi:hypothetical protein
MTQGYFRLYFSITGLYLLLIILRAGKIRTGENFAITGLKKFISTPVPNAKAIASERIEKYDKRSLCWFNSESFRFSLPINLHRTNAIIPEVKMLLQ